MGEDPTEELAKTSPTCCACEVVACRGTQHPFAVDLDVFGCAHWTAPQPFRGGCAVGNYKAVRNLGKENPPAQWFLLRGASEPEPSIPAGVIAVDHRALIL